jgi:hypothetical protein
MTTPDDDPHDELTRAYRSASDAQAESPAASTRAAILAEARAAALKRTPAANDSRYVWRAAAGIAVLGVAVILWRQTDHRLAPDLAAAPETTAAVQSPQAPQPAADMTRSDAAGAGTTVENRPTTVRRAESTAKDEKEASSRAAPAREEASAELAASQVVTSEVTASSAPPAQLARASADAAAPMPPPGAAQASGAVRQNRIDYQQLVQREFPEAWKGNEPPHTVWVVLAADGKVLRKGELSPGASVTADQPFESRRPWQMVNVVTASGSSLQLAVMSVN